MSRGMEKSNGGETSRVSGRPIDQGTAVIIRRVAGDKVAGRRSKSLLAGRITCGPARCHSDRCQGRTMAGSLAAGAGRCRRLIHGWPAGRSRRSPASNH